MKSISSNVIQMDYFTIRENKELRAKHTTSRVKAVTDKESVFMTLTAKKLMT